MTSHINNTLLPAKQTEVGKLILDNGFNIHDFKWNETNHFIPDPSGSAYGGTDVKCSMLVYTKTGQNFYFKFIFHGDNFLPEFSPGMDLQRVVKIRDTRHWNAMLKMFRAWLLLLREQLSVKDLWAEVIDFKEQYVYKDLSYGTGVYFNHEEKEILKKELNNIEKELLEVPNLLEDQKEYIRSGFISLDEKIEKLDKISWRIFFTGLMVDLWFFFLGIAADSRIKSLLHDAYLKILTIITPHIRGLLE